MASVAQRRLAWLLQQHTTAAFGLPVLSTCFSVGSYHNQLGNLVSSSQHHLPAALYLSSIYDWPAAWRYSYQFGRTFHTSLARLEDSKGLDENKGPNSPATSYNQVWNVPNLLSIGRIASGPVIAYLIAADNWVVALPLLAASGATDWLDGYLARKLNQNSVVGSYLDPLADKVLVGCVASALAWKGLLPLWVAGVVVGRDVFLVGGMFAHRFYSLGWRWPGWNEFFKTTDAAYGPSKGVPYMKPAMISKVNTVLQLTLVGAYLIQAQSGWPGPDTLHLLEYVTVATTLSSLGVYAFKYASGRMFPSKVGS